MNASRKTIICDVAAVALFTVGCGTPQQTSHTEGDKTALSSNHATIGSPQVLTEPDFSQRKKLGLWGL